MNSRRLLPLTLGVMLLTGCGALAPRTEAVAASPTTLPAAFPSNMAAPSEVTDVADWRPWVTDARAQRLVETALAGNRDLRAAVASLEQARQRAVAQGASEWPTVNAALAGSRTPTASGGVNRSYQAGVAVTAWEIDLFGRLANLTDAARAQALASEQARHAVQTSLVAGVVSGALALASDDEQLSLARATLATREDSLRLTTLRAERGVASELDLQSARSLVEAARGSLAQALRQRAQDENALALLLGQPLPADLAAPGALSGLQAGPELAAGVPAQVLAQRPDVRQAEATLAAAQANIGAARAALWPQITLTASAGTASNELAGLFRSGSWGFTLAPQLLYTLFDAGRNRANVAAAQAGRDAALAQYEKALQSAFREVADALAGRATLGDQLAAAQAQAQAEAERARLAELRWRGGVASSLELLDAQRSSYAAQQQVLQVQLARQQNQVALFKALGGGWQPAPATSGS